MSAAEQPHLEPIAKRTRRRITRRLAPFLFLLYILNYMARVNIGYAALDMTGDLGFSNAVFGFGAGIFFVGYFVLQVPGTLLVELWSARKFIGASLIIWGVLASLTGMITNATQFYWIRFLLGAAEAGFFPGVIVYLTHWYRYEDRGKAVAMFMMAIPLSNVLGSPIAAFLMRVNWLGYAGWRWLLILVGLPALLSGIAALYYLTDWPKDARWLSKEERQWITGELTREKETKKVRTKLSAWQAVRHPQVILLAVVYFCYITNSVGLAFWLPKIIQKASGLNTFTVTLVSAIPWMAAVPVMFLSGWHSDKTRERRWHTAGPMLIAAVALTLSQWAGGHWWLAILMFSLATMGIYAFASPFWALPTIFLTDAAAAASIALINSVGNLGGFAGPYAIGFLTDKTGTYAAGVYYLVGAGLLAGLLVLFMRTTRLAEEKAQA